MRLLGKTWLAIFIAANYFGCAKSSRTSDKAHSFFEHVIDQGSGFCSRFAGAATVNSWPDLFVHLFWCTEFRMCSPLR